MRVIRSADLPVSRWPNGAGRKADIAVGDGWMVGYAWLDGDAPFSDLAGMDRTITLVEGPGFTLDIAGRAPLVVHRLFEPARFDGGVPTACRVLGPCRVLNVMTARDRFRHTVAVRAAVDDGAAFAVVLRGTATVAGERLERLDAVKPTGGDVAGEGANAVLATITIRPA